MMKIKYHISATTEIGPGTISERILSLLDKPGYVILEKSSETIVFYHNIWRLGSRTKAYGMVDGGRFEINADGNRVVIKFDYYVSLVWWILILGFFSYFALTQEIHILYAIPVIFIFFCFHVWDVKNTAKGWMKDILNVA